MPKIFVDTSAWYAIADPSDRNHQSALSYRNQIARKYKLVISNYILDELYTLLLRLSRSYGDKSNLYFIQQRPLAEFSSNGEMLSLTLGNLSSPLVVRIQQSLK